MCLQIFKSHMTYTFLTEDISKNMSKKKSRKVTFTFTFWFFGHWSQIYKTASKIFKMSKILFFIFHWKLSIPKMSCQKSLNHFSKKWFIIWFARSVNAKSVCHHRSIVFMLAQSSIYLTMSQSSTQPGAAKKTSKHLHINSLCHHLLHTTAHLHDLKYHRNCMNESHQKKKNYVR